VLMTRLVAGSSVFCSHAALLWPESGFGAGCDPRPSPRNLGRIARRKRFQKIEDAGPPPSICATSTVLNWCSPPLFVDVSAGGDITTPPALAQLITLEDKPPFGSAGGCLAHSGRHRVANALMCCTTKPIRRGGRKRACFTHVFRRRMAAGCAINSQRTKLPKTPAASTKALHDETLSTFVYRQGDKGSSDSNRLLRFLAAHAGFCFPA